MKGQGKVKGILIEGNDGHEYLLGFGRSHQANWPYGWSDRTGHGEQHVALGCLSRGPQSVPPDSDLADLVGIRLRHYPLNPVFGSSAPATS